MTEPNIIVSDVADLALRDQIGALLAAYNKEQAGFTDYHPLSISVRDPETQDVVGGLIGRSAFGLLFIDLFVLPPARRGSGLGGRLLKIAEDEGRKRGCRAVTLYTINFQAPGFYEKQGYRRFGEIDCGNGISRIFMVKELN